MPIYEYQCIGCGHEFEILCIMSEREDQRCSICRNRAKMITTQMRTHTRFIEGSYDIGKGTYDVTSKRQLRELMKRHNGSVGEFEQSIAKVDDGYGGF